uniref:Zinc finger protein 177 n=1 Tax=Pipistrellus kuhlii TaxID=59472 RepID=A0A7J7TBQ8_PIPKU|nr:zinc finger protein 177 [Pipistrellus kuhlii]
MFCLLRSLPGEEGNRKERMGAGLLTSWSQAPTHPGEKPLEFGHCGKFFRKNCHLICSRYCKGNKCYKYKEYRKDFNHFLTLRNQMSTHSEDNISELIDCCRVFNLESSYREHSKSFTGEKSSECNKCLLSFSLHSSFSVHVQKPIGKKLCKCSDYGQRPSLSVHKNLCTEEGISKCGKHRKVFTGPCPFRNV